MNDAVRGMLIALLSVALVGFGLCGAAGTISGLASIFTLPAARGHYMNLPAILLTYGLMGLAIAGVCLFFVRRLQRKRPPGDA